MTLKRIELGLFLPPFAATFLSCVLLLFIYGEGDGRGTCGAGELRCQSSGYCVPKEKVCDGARDCDDGLDEHDMICVASKLRRGVCARGAPKKVGVFQCQYSGCIPLTRVCDGAINCLDGSDESEHVCGANSCLPGQFRCKYGACIADWRMCNGMANCPDASDESAEACKKRVCRDNEFQCKYGACIPASRICDSRKHCYDGSDESPELCLITRAKISLKWEKEKEEEERQARIEAQTALQESTPRQRHVSTTTPAAPEPRALSAANLPPAVTDGVARQSSCSDTNADLHSSPSLDNFSSSSHKTGESTPSGAPQRVDLAGNNFSGSAVGAECALPPIPYNAEATITSCRANRDAYYCSDKRRECRLE
jgi:hypothetical protein